MEKQVIISLNEYNELCEKVKVFDISLDKFKEMREKIKAIDNGDCVVTRTMETYRGGYVTTYPYTKIVTKDDMFKDIIENNNELIQKIKELDVENTRLRQDKGVLNKLIDDIRKSSIWVFLRHYKEWK